VTTHEESFHPSEAFRRHAELSGRHLYRAPLDLLRSWSAGSGGREATPESGTQPVPKIKKEDG